MDTQIDSSSGLTYAFIGDALDNTPVPDMLEITGPFIFVTKDVASSAIHANVCQTREAAEFSLANIVMETVVWKSWE